MPEPTDHRAVAEGWLIRAMTSVDEGAEGFSQAEALIGIGHALLANLAQNGVRPSRCGYRDPRGWQCALNAGHPAYHVTQPIE